MTLPQWPASLPAKPLRGGYLGTGLAAGRHLAMEAGAGRRRALFAASPVSIECGWRMTAEQFARFKAFYAGTLDDGAKWFSVPLWFGGAVQPAPAQFAGRYRASPRAASAVTVTGRLRVRALPFATPSTETLASFTDADGAIWPEGLPLPLRDGAGFDPHRLLPESDFEDGPAAKANPFPRGPAELGPRWSMTPAQFEIFKAFHGVALKQGAVWFRVPLWFGFGLETVEARATAPFTFALHKADRILVAMPVETRRLPLASEGTLAFLDWLGAEALGDFESGLGGFVEAWTEDFGS